MEEVVIVTSFKDEGFAVMDINTGANICADFKNTLCNPFCVCIIRSDSSFSGRGQCGDYIAISQSQKPIIHIYQWNKTQEITTALASDSAGTYLYGGTRGGRIFCWELSTGRLLQSWQAHFKAVSRIVTTACGLHVLSCSDDGMARVWSTAAVVGGASLGSASGSRSVSAYRSWSPHSLSVRDMCVLGAAHSLRALTCSLDRSLVLYDVHADKQCFALHLSVALECVATSCSQDFAFVGTASGAIYMIDLSTLAASLASQPSRSISAAGGNDSDDIAGVRVLEGHRGRVTSLCVAVDNRLLTSCSEDGCVRVWDVWNRQCLREVTPLRKMPLSNVLIIPRPEIVGSSVQRPALSSLGHLKKYMEGEGQGEGGQSSALGPVLVGRSRVVRDGETGRKRGVDDVYECEHEADGRAAVLRSAGEGPSSGAGRDSALQSDGWNMVALPPAPLVLGTDTNAVLRREGGVGSRSRDIVGRTQFNRRTDTTAASNTTSTTTTTTSTATTTSDVLTSDNEAKEVSAKGNGESTAGPVPPGSHAGAVVKAQCRLKPRSRRR